MKHETDTTTSTKQLHLKYHSPYYWRVTFDHPPLNVFGPETIPQLNEVITALETDEDVKVVVFDSAVEGFFLTHYNFLAKLEDTTSLPPGPTGLQPLPDMLVRLSRAPVVSIASIWGRATGPLRGTSERGVARVRRECAVGLPCGAVVLASVWKMPTVQNVT
jgi:enoyl-CoA hydratase/carnithine racemase